MRTVRTSPPLPLSEGRVPCPQRFTDRASPFPDAPSALAWAREISLEPADWVSKATPRMEPVTTAEQYAYALSAFDTARIYGNQAEPGVGPCLDELRRRTVVPFDNEEPEGRRVRPPVPRRDQDRIEALIAEIDAKQES